MKKFGQESFVVRNGEVEAWVTQLGGHLAPVSFRLGNRWVQPFSVAPWAEEPGREDLPAILRSLRGDFFCMPFGGNSTPFEGERYPVHGEPANAVWNLDDANEGVLDLSFSTTIRPGRVQKRVEIRPGETVVYQTHTVSGMEGPMCYGMHATLKFNSTGLLSNSSLAFGKVHPAFESVVQGGYNSLKGGARFSSLDAVPMANGGLADIGEYPAREGYEDLVQVFQDPAEAFSWWAVTFPEEGFVWFQLKNPRVLSSTVLWHSNGGRHYQPWNGRHRGVLGIEEVTSSFHDGLAESVAPNEASEAGFVTSVELNPEVPLVVKVVFGVAEIPSGFGRVTSVSPVAGGVQLSDSTSVVFAPLDLEFLTD
ncbi:MAG: hypothetical protein ACOYON_07720 [Fimbriimonas sp.]